ncbi:Os01g0928300 [Oryza sativa Japonica Group]|uniref:Os01g0928300 protein n=2 Tax=Oryza sativa subsp. japonica TaxID=39947 RepID=C7IWE6_ORYSJ|nr:hypothetical protein EE612_007733 [Oryza sativa]BAH91449.1 Os01g0928300 [Oryza sativa Japonica Group]BAS76012.1 Os01g0928300 [Oryza sativa Japonica Group]|eukprot:NP_001172719.1 Os01g0928300 [Oryza sativa Japonica Group]
MAAAARKGTATPLGAVFSPEETRRAVARVAEAVADRRAELGRLQGFSADNAALVSLVQRLPDEVSHDIMVPFGGAAFFPGRLIHTNELLGRGTMWRDPPSRPPRYCTGGGWSWKLKWKR